MDTTIKQIRWVRRKESYMTPFGETKIRTIRVLQVVTIEDRTGALTNWQDVPVVDEELEDE